MRGRSLTKPLNLYANLDVLSIPLCTLPMRGGSTLSVTDGEVPPKCLRLQAVPEFLLEMYTRFWDSLSFWEFF